MFVISFELSFKNVVKVTDGLNIFYTYLIVALPKTV